VKPSQRIQVALIGIAGPSGAGKSELARSLAHALDAPIVALDSYYRDLSQLPVEERIWANFDVPEALDAELLTTQLGSLSKGEEIRVPVYDCARHVRTGETRGVSAGSFAIVEGLFTLYWEPVRCLLSLKVFVIAEAEVCLRRRLERDMRERGRSAESVCAQYRSTVGPGAQRYIQPTLNHADLVLDGTDRIEDLTLQVLGHIRQRF
jgi:uridine kinase